MSQSLFFILLLSILQTSVSWAQESSGSQEKSMQPISREQSLPLIQQAPPANSQKLEEEHPRLFWILPTYTVTESKSARPLTAHGKFRLFVKDKTDPFTIGWVAFEAGLAQSNNDPSEYGQGASGYGKRFGAGLANETSAGFFGHFSVSYCLASRSTLPSPGRRVTHKTPGTCTDSTRSDAQRFRWACLQLVWDPGQHRRQRSVECLLS